MTKAIFNGKLSIAMTWMKGRGLSGKCPVCGAKVFPVISLGGLMSNHWKHGKGASSCSLRCQLKGDAARQFYRLKAVQRQIELDRKEKWKSLRDLYLSISVVNVNVVNPKEDVMKKSNSVVSEQVVETVEAVVIPKWNYVSLDKGWLFETIRSTEVKVDTVNTVLYKVLNGIDVSSEIGVDLSKVNFVAMKQLMNWFMANKEIQVRALNMISQNTNSSNTISWKSEEIDCLPINGKDWKMEVSLYRYGNNREQTHIYFSANGIKSVFLRFVIMRNTINWLFDLKKFAAMGKLHYEEVKYRTGEGAGEVYDVKAAKPAKETADEFVQRIMDKPIKYRVDVDDALKAIKTYRAIALDHDDPF